MSKRNHYIVCSEGGWIIQHLDSCRPDVTTCRFHRWMIEGSNQLQDFSYNGRELNGKYLIKMNTILGEIGLTFYPLNED